MVSKGYGYKQMHALNRIRWKNIILSIDNFFDKIIEKGRGVFCYELDTRFGIRVDTVFEY
jgi:arylamine N-acetyltransferase